MEMIASHLFRVSFFGEFSNSTMAWPNRLKKSRNHKVESENDAYAQKNFITFNEIDLKMSAVCAVLAAFSHKSRSLYRFGRWMTILKRMQIKLGEERERKNLKNFKWNCNRQRQRCWRQRQTASRYCSFQLNPVLHEWKVECYAQSIINFRWFISGNNDEDSWSIECEWDVLKSPENMSFFSPVRVHHIMLHDKRYTFTYVLNWRRVF